MRYRQSMQRFRWLLVRLHLIRLCGICSRHFRCQRNERVDLRIQQLELFQVRRQRFTR